MKPLTSEPRFLNEFKLKKAEFWIGISVLIIGVSVFQDYLYSRVQNTGFYISESLLYNSLWLFLAPFAFWEFSMLKRIQLKNKWTRLAIGLGLSVGLTLGHILTFTAFFVMVSYFIFSPTHHFEHIFKSALTNQFYILMTFYFLAPMLFIRLIKTRQQAESLDKFHESVLIKWGLKMLSLETDSIQAITTDKPYSVIFFKDKKFMDNRTLKEFETLLNPQKHARVHRSYIVNFNAIKELKSRHNGDYDALLQNGKTVRLSRHYRANWQHLLQ